MKSLLYYFLILFSLIPFTSALTSGEGTIIFASIFSLIMVVVFFLVISIIMNNQGLKMFFISLSFLTILFSVGAGVSVMQEYFSDLAKLTSLYGSFYILLVILSAAGLFALIVWLLITAVKSFNSYRGLSDED